MKSLKQPMLAALCALLLPWQAHALPLTYTFSLLPSGGTVSGTPGQLVGWGYALANTDDTNWFVPTRLSASSFLLGTPDAGYFDFPILAPGVGATLAFDPVAGQGLFGLQLLPGTLPGQSESGQFTLAGQWWRGDPFSGGVLLQPGDSVVAPLTVQVAGGAVPEPGSLLLLATGLLWVGLLSPLTLLRRRRQRPAM